MSKRKRYKKKARPQNEVELKMAAMLDMAFQLLAFFILTFRPSPIESQISLRMPPNDPVTKSAGGAIQPQEMIQDSFAVPLLMQLHAAEGGRIARIQLPNGALTNEGSDEQLFKSLTQTLGGYFGSTLYDGVSIQVDIRVKYEFLLQVINSCSQQKLPSGEPMTKISFAAMP